MHKHEQENFLEDLRNKRSLTLAERSRAGLGAETKPYIVIEFLPSAAYTWGPRKDDSMGGNQLVVMARAMSLPCMLPDPTETSPLHIQIFRDVACQGPSLTVPISALPHFAGLQLAVVQRIAYPHLCQSPPSAPYPSTIKTRVGFFSILAYFTSQWPWVFLGDCIYVLTCRKDQ